MKTAYKMGWFVCLAMATIGMIDGNFESALCFTWLAIIIGLELK